uniref:Lipase 1 n=1 Tax=Cacopsylla melanoneura TaxID=428564 RepID=A0A8D9AJ73_9HEMI
MAARRTLIRLSFFIPTLVCGTTVSFNDNRYLSPEMFGKLRGDEIMKFYGYPGEEHKVRTEDGYILTNFRMPNPGGYPVLLLHGLTLTSDSWLLGGPTHDIPYHLWRRGYDVWLWNARGNGYSTEHVNLTYTEKNFWKFSSHELGLYDTPAIIDYILNLTND